MTDSDEPRLRRGWVHSYNNYLLGWENCGSGSSEGGQLASEANVYQADQDIDGTVTSIADDSQPGNLRSTADFLINGAQVAQLNPESVFNPSDFYEYQVEPAGNDLF